MPLRGTRKTLGSGGWRPTFLLRDDFTVTEAAPMVTPRICDGVGSLVITDTLSKVSISGGRLTFVTGGAAGGDPGLWGALQTRSSGLAIIVEGTHTSGILHVGWDSNQVGFSPDSIVFASNTAIFSRANSVSVATGAIVAATPYFLAAILRGTGCLYLIKGGVYTSWTLLYVGHIGTDNRYPIVAVGGTTAVSSVGWVRSVQLPSPFTSDYGIATQRTAAPGVDATIASEANALIEFTWTAVAAETVELSTRRTDDNDRWIVRGSQSGSTVKLIEVVGGVETERGSAAQTWTATTAYRIIVGQDGANMRVYVADVFKFAYASASTNATATGVKTNKAGTDLISWPRTIPTAATALLDVAVA